MRRGLVLGAIVATGMLAAVAAQAPQRGGQPPAGGRGGGGGLGEIQKVADNLYMIPGAGGNVAVFITSNGVVLVDSKNPNNGQGILDRVQSVSKLPITHLINTHTHADHVGSNAFFPASVEIVTQANTSTNMQKMANFADAATKQGLPDRTFTDRMTLLTGNDSIDLYYFGAAHTNGDALVVFRNLRVMHAGDMFAGKNQPLLDANNGGSGIAYGETIGKAASGIKNVERVITGHSTVLPWQDFVDYGEFNRLFVQHARASLKAGQTPEQALASLKLPEKFKDYNLAGGRGGPGGNFNAVFQELQKQ